MPLHAALHATFVWIVFAVIAPLLIGITLVVTVRQVRLSEIVTAYEPVHSDVAEGVLPAAVEGAQL